MGFRYDEKEKAVFTSFDMLRAGRRIARLGDAPIDPDADDIEALEFLYNIQMNFEDRVGNRDLASRPFDFDIAYEIADDSVPYNDYKAAMAYAQLGLYKYDDLEGDTTYAGDPIKSIRYALFSFANKAVEEMLDDF
jgi:hypothetical protein